MRLKLFELKMFLSFDREAINVTVYTYTVLQEDHPELITVAYIAITNASTRYQTQTKAAQFEALTDHRLQT